ncbi:hypothetical protein [Ralstonia flatus]|uniref:Uncharacterized protein n=1 Tax=Ralstonia flatus TaxID=3058601 RepID=A0ABM9L1X9_9RALS|nr:hypothetical protein [Ralstonia sp. LMG 32965]CAJ0896533.1 hypothetical protein R77564_04002 [Ralstonia sp. LMG 32965]
MTNADLASTAIDADTKRNGEASIARLIAAEMASGRLDERAIALSLGMIDMLRELSERKLSGEDYAILADGIGETLRMIARQTEDPTADLEAIAGASLLCADIANLIDAQLMRMSDELSKLRH